MNDASWIDDIIKQHKTQLDILKNKKNIIEENLSLKGNFPIINYRNNETQKFNTIYQFDNDKTPFNLNSNINNNNISSSQEISTLKILNNEEKENLKEENKNLKEENEKLKEENKNLKEENEKLKEENKKLKGEKKNLNNKLEEITKKLNENNNNIIDMEKYKTMIEQLNTQLNKIKEEKENNLKKMKQIENIKNQEIELMNQKMKNFDVIIEENSKNYLNDVRMLKTQIKNNKAKLEECNKYVEIVNFFISKIDYIFGIQSKQIYDIQELQNKFVEIENLIQNIINSNFKKSTNIKIEENNQSLKENEDNNINDYNNNNDDNNINNDNINNNNNMINNNNFTMNNNKNTNFKQLKVPHFQNEILEQGLCNYKSNPISRRENRDDDKFSIFKNLEQRIIDLERKLYQSPNQESYKVKNIHHNYKRINSNENKYLLKNKDSRSKSTGKFNNEKLENNHYKNYNSNLNYNQHKKVKKNKKTKRKKTSKNKNENPTKENNNNNNNDNYSISNNSNYSNLKSNLVK